MSRDSLRPLITLLATTVSLLGGCIGTGPSEWPEHAMLLELQPSPAATNESLINESHLREKAPGFAQALDETIRTGSVEVVDPVVGMSAWEYLEEYATPLYGNTYYLNYKGHTIFAGHPGTE